MRGRVTFESLKKGKSKSNLANRERRIAILKI
jgi:hypothetical protein